MLLPRAYLITFVSLKDKDRHWRLLISLKSHHFVKAFDRDSDYTAHQI